MTFNCVSCIEAAIDNHQPKAILDEADDEDDDVAEDEYEKVIEKEDPALLQHDFSHEMILKTIEYPKKSKKSKNGQKGKKNERYRKVSYGIAGTYKKDPDDEDEARQLPSRQPTASTVSSSSSSSSSPTASSGKEAASTSSLSSSSVPKPVSVEGDPVLFFPPLGWTPRMLLLLDELFKEHHLKVICVDRQKQGDVTQQGSSEGSHKCDIDATKPPPSSKARKYLDTCCEDTIAVLDALEIPKVSVLAMCAGTSFALAFCNRNPDRITGKVLIIAPWILPLDCPTSSSWYRFAANYLPKISLGNALGNFRSSMINFFSMETIVNKMYEKCSPDERQGFEKRFSDRQSLIARYDWMMKGTNDGNDGLDITTNSYDVAVCISSGKDLGIDYTAIKSSSPKTNKKKSASSSRDQRDEIAIWHGDKDNLTSVEAVTWLSEELPDATLHIIPDGTHSGHLLMLHDDVAASLKLLKMSSSSKR